MIKRFTEFINEADIQKSLPQKDPDTVYRAIKQVVNDYFGEDKSSIAAVTIDVKYSAYYQQDKNWKCWLKVDFDKAKLEQKDISELKRLISDCVKDI